MKHLKNQDGILQQTALFAEDSRNDLANHTQSQDLEKGLPTKDISFLRCLELSKRSNQVGLLGKMFVDLLVGMEGWYSTRCALTWKAKVTKSNRFLYQLQASMPHTKGIESGLLLTPTTKENVVNLNTFQKRMEKYPNGTTMPNLATQIHSMLPTPTTQEPTSICEVNDNGRRLTKDKTDSHSLNLGRMAVMGMLPTPTTRDYKGARTTEALEKSGRTGTNSLPDAFHQAGKTFQLNPLFVEEMMGFPEHWTLSPFLNGETNLSKPTETQ